jgi:hypothetical protein
VLVLPEGAIYVDIREFVATLPLHEGLAGRRFDQYDHAVTTRKASR